MATGANNRKRIHFFDAALIAVLGVFSIITLYPFYNVLILSFSNSATLARHTPYPCLGLLNGLASWGQSQSNRDYPADAPTEAYRDGDFDLVAQAEATGELPNFDMRITYLSTPLKDQFIIYQADDLMAVMMGSEPVEKMVEDLVASYEAKGLEAMIQEVNEKAAELGY